MRRTNLIGLLIVSAAVAALTIIFFGRPLLNCRLSATDSAVPNARPPVATTQAAGKVSPEQLRACEEAPQVLVGRVIEPEPVYPRSNIWKVHVVQMLKGHDETGQDLQIEANGERGWTFDKTYLICFRDRVRGGCATLPAIANPTEYQIKLVADAIRQHGGAVTARRILWVQEEPGWPLGTRDEFWLTATGEFSRTTTELAGKPLRDISGKLPQGTVADLLRVAAAQESDTAQVDDAPVTTTRYDDAAGSPRWVTMHIGWRQSDPLTKRIEQVVAELKPRSSQPTTAPPAP